MNELFDETFGDLIEHDGNDIYTQMFYDNLLDDHESESEKKKIHKMINFNYEIKSAEESCFKIDIDLIQYLIKKKINVNECDNLGNTPIYYAIDMQNKDLIQYLKENGAIIGSARQNKQNISAYEYALNTYGQVLNVIDINKYTICKELTKNLITKLTKSPQFGNNIPSYTHMLLQLCLYLLNHHIYMLDTFHAPLSNYIQTLFQKPST